MDDGDPNLRNIHSFSTISQTTSKLTYAGFFIMGCSQNLDAEANHDEMHELRSWRDWAAVLLWSLLGYLCIILTVISYYSPSLLPFDPTTLVFNKEISPFFAFSQGSGHFLKPRGFKIVALVPFKYHDRTAILDCYLQVSLIYPAIC